MIRRWASGIAPPRSRSASDLQRPLRGLGDLAAPTGWPGASRASATTASGWAFDPPRSRSIGPREDGRRVGATSRGRHSTTSLTKSSPRSSSSGWRFCQTIGGISGSSPHPGDDADQDGKRVDPLDLPARRSRPGAGRRATGRRPARATGLRIIGLDLAGSCPPPGRPRRGRSGRRRSRSRPVEVRARAGRSPISVQRACIRAFRGALVVEDERLELRDRVAGSSRSRRRRWAVSRIVDVGAGEPVDQLVVGLLGQVELRGPGRVLVADPVEPPLEAVDPGGVAVGVLVAVVAVVPVEDVERAVGAGLLDDGHEPGVVGGEEVGLGRALGRSSRCVRGGRR